MPCTENRTAEQCSKGAAQVLATATAGPWASTTACGAHPQARKTQARTGKQRKPLLCCLNGQLWKGQVKNVCLVFFFFALLNC